MAKYNKANGYEADSEVIYGDTDSVMVNFKVRVLQPAAIAFPPEESYSVHRSDRSLPSFLCTNP